MCCCKCINKLFEILLWLFSFLIFLLGVTLVVIPLVIYYDDSFDSVTNFIETLITAEQLETYTWVIVAIGIATLIISCIGCGAAKTDHKCAKIVFFGVNLVAAAGLGAIGGVVFSRTTDLSTNLQQALSNYTLIYLGPDNADNTVTQNFVQDFEQKYTEKNLEVSENSKLTCLMTFLLGRPVVECLHQAIIAELMLPRSASAGKITRQLDVVAILLMITVSVFRITQSAKQMEHQLASTRLAATVKSRTTLTHF